MTKFTNISWRATATNNLWQWFARSAWRTFQRKAIDLQTTQTTLLKTCLTQNASTRYGQRFNFAGIKDVKTYQKNVPLTTYDDYEADIEAIAKGESHILTAAPVTMFEPSSGSSRASKLLPYTPLLKAEFQRAIASWIYTLFTAYPHLKQGRAYWSVTPLTQGQQTTSGGIPIGFEADSAYLGKWGEMLLTEVLAVPNAIKYVQDITTFRYLTLLFLLHQPTLRLISVWNPTFLTLLLKPLPQWWDMLLTDIAEGRLTPPGGLPPAVQAKLSHQLTPNPQRATQLAILNPTDYTALWPDLHLISCWLDGPSAQYQSSLAQQFPNVNLQSKGLIATEAFVSFPLPGFKGAVLAFNSHFFEFLPLNPETHQPVEDEPHLAHQLDLGQRYAVVVTTGGGFYRYQLHDVVEVVDYFQQVPCFRFLGKLDRVSDWFGEKLNEHFVAGVLVNLWQTYTLLPLFAMLAPDDSSPCFCYTLYLELADPSQIEPHLSDLTARLEVALSQNFHYNYCRQLSQLGPAQIYLIAPEGMATYLAVCQERGHRLGDIKPPHLDNQTGWGNKFILYHS